MNSLTATEADTLVAGRADWIADDAVTRLATDPLDCVETEYPHYVRPVDGPDDVPRPRDQHPVFFGCFDWHSAVHSHWALVRGLRLFEDHPAETAVVETVEDRLTDEAVAGEVAYFEEHETFERPYGWAWLLRLAGELHLWDADRADAWRATLRPLEARVVELFETEFCTQDRPYRVGTHANSAFALACGLDYARTVGDDAFVDWLTEFLPAPADLPTETVIEPVELGEEPGGGELHFAGLYLSRAWCLAGLADALDDHPYVDPFERGAQRHAELGVSQAFPGDYGGSHWLSSFALYLLTRNEGGIAPS